MARDYDYLFKLLIIGDSGKREAEDAPRETGRDLALQGRVTKPRQGSEGLRRVFREAEMEIRVSDLTQTCFCAFPISLL